jgi:glycosyltransferase 2 family protein
VKLRPRIPRSPWTRSGIAIAFLCGVGALLWWHGPHWADFGDAFRAVDWRWVVAAVGLNLLSVVARAAAWDTVIHSAMPPPHPRLSLVFSAFSVGLLANAVLPGRVGEFARVAVLSRKMNGRQGLVPTLVGTVFAHRVFDLVPVGILVVWVLATAKIPGWAFTSLAIVLSVGVGLFLFAFATARVHGRTRLEGMGTVMRVVTMARHGLGVMRRFRPAALAISGQCAGWTCQLFAVWTAMLAFDIHEALPAAGLVLLLMNVATIVPLWPGNVGLVQAAIALPLVQYGVPYGKGFAFGLGLQAIEASVGIGVGLIFLGREGLSFAGLREMPGAATAEVSDAQAREEPPEREPARARVPG